MNLIERLKKTAPEKELEKRIYTTFDDMVFKIDDLKVEMNLHFYPTMFYSIFSAMKSGFNGTSQKLVGLEKQRKGLYQDCYKYGIPKKELKYGEYKLFLKAFMRNPIDKYDRSTLLLSFMLYGGAMFESYHFLNFVEKDLYKIKKKVDTHRKSKLEDKFVERTRGDKIENK